MIRKLERVPYARCGSIKPWTVPPGLARIWTLLNEQLDVRHSGAERDQSAGGASSKRDLTKDW